MLSMEIVQELEDEMSWCSEEVGAGRLMLCCVTEDKWLNSTASIVCHTVWGR